MTAVLFTTVDLNGFETYSIENDPPTLGAGVIVASSKLSLVSRRIDSGTLIEHITDHHAHMMSGTGSAQCVAKDFAMRAISVAFDTEPLLVARNALG
ncbi:MAG: hypothetical protein RLZZ480_816 [Candidatus Parcubacteria bacterium]